MSKYCQKCGTENEDKAKKCVQCGKKFKKPWYKKVWVWILAGILSICLFSCAVSDGDTSTADTTKSAVKETTAAKSETKSKEVKETVPETIAIITYENVELKELESLIDTNATEAEKYTDKDITVTGYVCSKDSDGKYFNIVSKRSMHSLYSEMQVYPTSATQEVSNSLNVGDKVTINLHITSVGEIIGYHGDVVEIVSVTPHEDAINEPITIYENNDILIQAKSLDDSTSSPEIKLYVENNSNKHIRVQLSDDGIAVNGFTVDGGCYFDVASGKKTNDHISIYNSSLEENDIEEMITIEFALEISNYDDWSDKEIITDTIIINITE